MDSEVGERDAGEVQEVDPQAAAHHPVGGHRGVDAAGHQHQAPAAAADRQPALARQPAGEDERLVAVDLDGHARRVLQVDRQAVALVDLAADRAVQLHRGEREALVAAAGADREGT